MQISFLRMLPFVAAVTLFCLPSLSAEEPASNKSEKNGAATLTADQALKTLQEGNTRFANDKSREAQPQSRRRLDLVNGQRPIAVVLTCSDSRAAPEIVFDKQLGELFVVRVAGNVGGPEVYASIEYALAELKTPLVVVLGHTQCGAVDAALKGQEQPTPNLAHLVELIHTGTDLPHDHDAELGAAIHNNVLFQTSMLTGRSKIIRDFTTKHGVRIVPAIYDLKTGVVHWLDSTAK